MFLLTTNTLFEKEGGGKNNSIYFYQISQAVNI
jgi:hypothetical protein